MFACQQKETGCCTFKMKYFERYFTIMRIVHLYPLRSIGSLLRQHHENCLAFQIFKNITVYASSLSIYLSCVRWHQGKYSRSCLSVKSRCHVLELNEMPLLKMSPPAHFVICRWENSKLTDDLIYYSGYWRHSSVVVFPWRAARV